jgi:C4-dicarboxylate-specific signal transduction histidine kinase
VLSRSSWLNTLAGEQAGPDGDVATREALRLAELGLLTAGLIHELRQPLFALKALAQIAEANPARAAEHLASVAAQVRTLEALVAGYADFSRRPAGTREVFELAAPVRSAMAVLAHRAVAAHVRLDVELGPAVAVRSCQLAVQQAVVNLGQNAIDALKGQREGRLSILGATCDAGGLLRIQDNGPGLPTIIRDHLFQPFHTTKSSGTGLGLAISRDLVTAGGGELRLVEVDEGTCWEILLPAA